MHEIRAYLTGDVVLQRLFMQLPRAVQERVVVPLIEQGSKILDDAVKQEAPVESGLMKLAIGSSKLMKYSGGTIFITIGVRRGFRRVVTANTKGKIRVRGKAYTESHPNESVRNPTKYLHLVTGGRKAITARPGKILASSLTKKIFGKTVRSVAPNPFIERAFKSAKDQVVETILREAPVKIEKEAERGIGD